MSGLLMSSDVASGFSMAVFSYAHQQKSMGKLAAYSVLSSIAGRYVSYWLSNGSIDQYTANLVTPAIKDYLIVGLARYALALATKEPNGPVRSFDTVLNDILGVELLKALNMQDKPLLGGPTTATTAPVSSTK